jgi:UDP-N-acetylglucosamine 2-epimerase (non-hydrolysing)
MKTLHLICAARPNFMKIAPLYHALKNETWANVKIIHTGQHYDYEMSQAFFDDLKLPKPDYYLNAGRGSHAEQTATVMVAYEKLCLENRSDLTVVVGDVNSTMACAITAKKLGLKVAHLEAGLRSFDRTMPEEINRILTDSISDYHWTPSEDADANLLREGIQPKQISRVGNIMIDAYCMMAEKINRIETWKRFQLSKQGYAVLTLHRPVNVDDPLILSQILNTIGQLENPVIFPVHPRTQKTVEALEILPSNLRIVDPMGYIQFMGLVLEAAYVITDSGGLQEETTYLGIPCFTLRETTERPITVTMGSNQLVSVDNFLEKILYQKEGEIPPLWDGKTAQRLVQLIQYAF